jgi:hypothetical protein
MAGAIGRGGQSVQFLEPVENDSKLARSRIRLVDVYHEMLAVEEHVVGHISMQAAAYQLVGTGSLVRGSQ